MFDKGVNLLESLGVHFIITNPDNLWSNAMFMELGQISFKLLFLNYVQVSQDLKKSMKRKMPK